MPRTSFASPAESPRPSFRTLRSAAVATGCASALHECELPFPGTDRGRVYCVCVKSREGGRRSSTVRANAGYYTRLQAQHSGQERKYPTAHGSLRHLLVRAETTASCQAPSSRQGSARWDSEWQPPWLCSCSSCCQPLQRGLRYRWCKALLPESLFPTMNKVQGRSTLKSEELDLDLQNGALHANIGVSCQTWSSEFRKRPLCFRCPFKQQLCRSWTCLLD